MKKINTIGGSSERFGYEWEHYSDILPEYEEQFRRWLPFFLPADWIGRSFLDVGCGMGRNSYFPMCYGAARGMAIDVDERSLAAARRNLGCFPNVQVGYLSVYDIAWQDEYDIVFSIGVIHHLEQPELALRRMVASVKPGGIVAIWVYGRENMGLLIAVLDPLRKLLFSRLPISWVHLLSNIPATALWLGLNLGLGKIDYFRLIRRFSYKHLRSIVFDQMLPRIANYACREEVEQLMQNSGLIHIELEWINEMSWAAKGVKPQK
jgi:SAM-dependent methyltransferase